MEEDGCMTRRGWMNESGGWMVEWKIMNKTKRMAG